MRSLSLPSNLRNWLIKRLRRKKRLPREPRPSFRNFQKTFSFISLNWRWRMVEKLKRLLGEPKHIIPAANGKTLVWCRKKKTRKETIILIGYEEEK